MATNHDMLVAENIRLCQAQESVRKDIQAHIDWLKKHRNGKGDIPNILRFGELL